MKKNIFIICLLFFISISSFIFPSSIFTKNTDNLKFKKQLEIQQIKPKKPVKIKLKRLSNGNYTWDLTGDDLQEIIKIDKELRRLLKLE